MDKKGAVLQSSHLLRTLIKDVAKSYAMTLPPSPSRDARGSVQERESFRTKDERKIGERGKEETRKKE